jgi:hypothetical protein
MTFWLRGEMRWPVEGTAQSLVPSLVPGRPCSVDPLVEVRGFEPLTS